MRKSSLFTADDLQAAETKTQTYNRKVAHISKDLDMADDDAEELARKIASTEKRKRYAPLKDGTRAIAKIQFAKDAFGLPIIRESKGAKWIDAKFILEGKYNNRWIPHRFMLSGQSEHIRRLMVQTADFRRCIFSSYGIDENERLSKADGLRVPVMIGIHNRHGDGKEQNYISFIMSSNPLHPTYFDYEDFAKTRKAKLMPDPVNGKKRRWIDFPGWHLRPHTKLAMTLQERINNFDERVKKNLERAGFEFKEEEKETQE